LIFFSVEGLRKQLDETNMQREQLEKIQVTIAEELRSTRNRLEVDASNINSLTSEVRQRTRKLEDDHRLTVRFQTNESIQKLKNILRMILYVNNKKLSMLAIFFSIHFAPHVIKSITNLIFFFIKK
jgi:hypothetical protein